MPCHAMLSFTRQVYAEPLLHKVPPDSSVFATAQLLLRYLQNFQVGRENASGESGLGATAYQKEMLMRSCEV